VSGKHSIDVALADGFPVPGCAAQSCPDPWWQDPLRPRDPMGSWRLMFIQELRAEFLHHQAVRHLQKCREM